MGMPSRIISIDNAAEFWETERKRQWELLAPSYRASFSWPVSGQVIQSPANTSICAFENSRTVKQDYGLDVGYKYFSLDAMRTNTSNPAAAMMGNQNNAVEPSQRDAMLEQVHDMAFSNFCLFVFKPLQVDRTSYGTSSGVPTRTIMDSKNEWHPSYVNP
jgi:hypothetical protein